MKQILILFLCIISLATNAQTETETIVFQAGLNKQYGNKQSSPLLKKDLKNFKGLPFYAWNKELIVTAKVVLTPKSPLFKIETTTDRSPLYQQYAIATFTINGKEQQLSIYQSQDSKFNFDYQNYLFLPFKDTTNGIETYEGGRYIDIMITDIVNNEVLLDFNKAYNPYCAYNHKYSCPVPPSENHLNIAIDAGVKKGLNKQ